MLSDFNAYLVNENSSDIEKLFSVPVTATVLGLTACLGVSSLDRAISQFAFGKLLTGYLNPAAAGLFVGSFVVVGRGIVPFFNLNDPVGKKLSYLATAYFPVELTMLAVKALKIEAGERLYAQACFWSMALRVADAFVASPPSN